LPVVCYRAHRALHSFPTRRSSDLGRRWTWCSLDAVGIVAAVGWGKIDSTGPGAEFHIAYRDTRFDPVGLAVFVADGYGMTSSLRSEEHTSELQSRENLVCRLLLEK